MTIYTKVCRTCKIAKPAKDFANNKTATDGLQRECKQCQREYRKANKDRNIAYQKQYYKDNKKQLLEQAKEYYEEHKEKINAYNRDYYKDYYQENKETIKDYREANRDRIAGYQKEYREANKEEMKEYNREYQRVRYASDPIFALIKRMRTLVYNSLNNLGYTKKSRTHEIIGCSYEELRTHIESLFTEGMSWDNRGDWHIDHRMPISWGKTEEEIIALNHYKNLKPMWALDNNLKSNNYED